VRYLALLRGVNNIGAGKRVAMADLRVLFEGLGFTDVSTLGNSGNVVFAAPEGAGQSSSPASARRWPRGSR